MPCNPQEILIQSLQRPEAFPHDVDEIELIETHISWVLLTGQFAYKIKKPVDLGFVDFTTLERRQFFCEEELRLNGRLAPHIYLDVVSITGTPERPKIGGDGESIEFAVRMKQFPSDALLSRVLARNELKPEHIDSLANEVADFHAKIDQAPAESPFGTPERVHEPVVENFRHIEIDPGDARRQDQLRRLRDWSDREHALRFETFAARKAGGFVRECHGDMHLGNMILDGNRVVLFDCIEFNESLRWVDVISEVAFCTMDLADRGRPDLAHRFLNAYLERTGDYAGLAVFPCYVVYRAMVRAKVTGIRLKQDGLDEEERTKLTDECRDYLDLAEKYARKPHPWLAITHGFSGSGKTTLTQPVVEQCGAIRIRSDVERKRLFGYEATDDTRSGLGTDIYVADASERTYARLAELAQASLAAGFPTIVDATFLKHSQRETFRKLAADLIVPFRILDFRAPAEVLKQRIAVRQREQSDASEADVAVLAHQLQTHEALAPEEMSAVIAVDTQSPTASEQLTNSLRNFTVLGERPA